MTGFEVLIVDDNLLNIRIVQSNLSREFGEIKIHCSSTIENAIETFSSNNISIVLLDMFLGIGKSGIELYKDLRAIKSNFRCIGMSNYSIEYGFTAGRAGIDEFLSKPFKSKDLINAVKFQIKSLRNEIRGTAFCIMPFDEDLYDVYYFGIKQVLNERNYECFRIDEKIFNDAIIKQIQNSINTSDLIIADLTGGNPNVYYELGLAHAKKKKVILVASGVEDLKFDIQHMRTIIYNNKISILREKLIDEIDNFE